MDEKRSFTTEEVQALREKLMRMMGSHAAAYPHAVEQAFPRILAKLVEVWETPERAKYLDELTFSSRAGRIGFQGAVANELFNLSTIYAAPPESALPEAKGWSSGNTA
jgi:hypothetical protein